MKKVLEITDRAWRERMTGDLTRAVGLYLLAAAVARQEDMPALAESSTRQAIECELMLLATVTD